MKEISKAEEVVLLAILRLEKNAYGVSIRRQIIQTAGKDYTYGTLYGLLRQLVCKGFVHKRLGDPTPEKGGRRKAYFDLTSQGVQALKDAIAFHSQVWKDLDKNSFDRV
ncbi:PadR family transcriptional regulator [Acidobacteriota bacterium]